MPVCSMFVGTSGSLAPPQLFLLLDTGVSWTLRRGFWAAERRATLQQMEHPGASSCKPRLACQEVPTRQRSQFQLGLELLGAFCIHNFLPSASGS